MVSIQVTGVEKVVANLNKIEANIRIDMRQMLFNAADKFTDIAIKTLEDTGLRWPTSVNSIPIRNKSSWVKVQNSDKSVVLTCISDHASAVEFGTFGSPKLSGDGKFHAYDLTKNRVAFPIGLNQGILVRFAASIRPQPPKSFIRSNLDNPTTISAIADEVAKVIKHSINSVRG